MKQVLLKKIVIVVGKLTRSKVLWGGARLRGALRSGDGTRKNSLSCRVRQEWSKTKPCGARAKTPSFVPTPPRPIAILSSYIVYL